MTTEAPTVSYNREDRFHEALASFEQARDDGRNPDPAAWLARYPDVADLLVEHFKAEEEIERRAGRLPSIPGYEVLGHRGAGNMGDVYQARQVALDRPVAVKRIKKRLHTDVDARERFRAEAKAMARLEHPGIVPVYDLAQDADGQPCYAMRYIDGETLRDAIGRFHQAEKPGRDPGERRLALRQLLSQFVVVCNTLAYAHSRKVIHRDVKPGNIMLGQYGETLVVDWGLAKLIAGAEAEPATAEEVVVPDSDTGRAAGRTQPGQAVGTPAYMSPEQAAGLLDRVGPASDIYGLGATLYALLTGQPPIQGSSLQEILEKAGRGDFVSPRQLKRGIPRALEAICLKAMAFAPEERYATALELAAEVEHWLAGEPVRAYPDPWTTRARRWVKRHRLPVTAVAAAVLAAVVLGGGAWLRQVQAEAATALEVQQTRTKAEQLYQEGKVSGALAAARRAEALLEKGGGTEALRQQVKQLLADLTMADQLVEIRLPQAELRPDGGGFDIRKADPEFAALFKDNQLDVDSLAPEEAAARIRKRLIKDRLVAALDYWAEVRRRTGKGEAARWQRLLQVARLADPDPWRNRIRDALERRNVKALLELAESDKAAFLPAPTLLLLGIMLREREQTLAAEKLLRQAQAQHRADFWLNHELAVCCSKMKPPKTDDQVRFLTAALALRSQSAVVHSNLGNALVKKGQLDEAVAAYRQAIRLQKDFAVAHFNLGVALRDKGQLDEAIAAYRQAIRLKKHFPEAHSNLGNALRAKGQLDEAIAACREAIRLKQDYPEAHNNLGNALTAKGDLDGAIACYREAIRLKKDFPEAHCNLGRTLLQKGQLDEAIAAYREAIRLKKDYAEAHYNLGITLEKKGQLDEAVAACREAIRLKQDYPEAHSNLGVALAAKGRLDEAIAAYREAIRLKKDYPEAHSNLGVALAHKGQRDEAVAAFRQAIRLKQDYPEAHNNLGLALRQKGQLGEAIAAYREAIRLKQDFPEAHYNLGLAFKRKGQLDEAIAAYRKAISFKKDYAEPYCNLGHLLQHKGQFAEALAALKRGHELGSRNPRWPYPSAQWVRQCERWLQLDARLPAILRGEITPVSDAERVELALVCGMKQLYRSAARFFEEAFTGSPALAEDLKRGNRYAAARAAARAGCGQGEEATKLDEKERARWRKQALKWLEADLVLWTKQLESGTPQDRKTVAARLQHWQRDRDLAGIRDAALLAKLPPAEQEACTRLWAQVEAVLQKAQGKASARASK
jgi:eukaryotic-like serine/threonine-protein kinase